MDNNQAEIWEQRLKEYEQSGQTIAAWCKHNNIKRNQFFYWRRKLRPKKKQESQIKWIAASHNPAQASGINVTLGQIKIEITPGFDPKLLKEIIEVLTSP
jgi:transposase-like protein